MGIHLLCDTCSAHTASVWECCMMSFTAWQKVMVKVLFSSSKKRRLRDRRVHILRSQAATQALKMFMGHSMQYEKCDLYMYAKRDQKKYEETMQLATGPAVYGVQPAVPPAA